MRSPRPVLLNWWKVPLEGSTNLTQYPVCRQQISSAAPRHLDLCGQDCSAVRLSCSVRNLEGGSSVKAGCACRRRTFYVVNKAVSLSSKRVEEGFIGCRWPEESALFGAIRSENFNLADISQREASPQRNCGGRPA